MINNCWIHQQVLLLLHNGVLTADMQDKSKKGFKVSLKLEAIIPKGKYNFIVIVFRTLRYRNNVIIFNEGWP